MATGSIYLVPVPIGNLGDITLRAQETLKRVHVIAAEDTRSTRFLLSQYEITPPRLLSLHKYNEKQRIGEILELLAEGNDLAVVTDAGSPGISDPAGYLIQSAIEHGIVIIPLPGATALIPALTASGLPTQPFQFLGFLPLKGKDRKAALESIRTYLSTSVIYEAPHRLRKTLTDLLAHCGDRNVCICREITKIYEQFIRGKLSDILEDYAVTEKGEMVIVIGADDKPLEEASDSDIQEFISTLLPGKPDTKSLTNEVCLRFGISRNRAYQLILSHKNQAK